MDHPMKQWLIQCALNGGALLIAAVAKAYDLYLKKP
jgi:hypothetical protein